MCYPWIRLFSEMRFLSNLITQFKIFNKLQNTNYKIINWDCYNKTVIKNGLMFRILEVTQHQLVDPCPFFIEAFLHRNITILRDYHINNLNYSL